MRLLLQIAIVAAAYWLSGRAGLLLAVPPGYATAIWPASGIALAAAVLCGMRVLPGVALGSFALNIATAWDPAAPFGSALVPGAIALGATAQAGFGAWLIARYVGYRNVLVQEQGAVKMLVLGGPVACLLNAVVGVGTLTLAGRIESDAVGLNLATWWVGDTIGVLIFAPLVWVWAERPYSEWLQRQLFVTVPLLGLFFAVIAMFVAISRHEQARLADEFDNTTRTFAREVRKDFTSALDSLNALEGLFASSQTVDAREFARFAERLTVATPSIRGLTWNPLVTAGERARFEAAARASGETDYTVLEQDAQGALRPAAARERYTPIRFIAPASTNEAALGFDASSEPARRVALDAARDTGRPAATARVALVQGGSGFVVFTAMFREGDRPGGLHERRAALVGYAGVVLDQERVMRETLRGVHEAGIGVELIDAGAMSGDIAADTGPELRPSGGLRNVLRVPFAGRELHLVFALPAQTLLAHRSWATWAVLAGGLALTSLVGVMLLLGVGREAHFEQLVHERTASLRASEEALRREATHDHLTGLPSRSLFLDRLEQALQHSRREVRGCALLYLDLDGFKPVNDGLGHAAGDALLCQVAGDLRESVRGVDTAARLGGDEFAVILTAPQDAATAMAKAAEIVAKLGRPRTLEVTGREPAPARIGASVGVALFPVHGDTVDALMHAADTAMYEAKRGGKNSSRLAG